MSYSVRNFYDICLARYYPEMFDYLLEVSQGTCQKLYFPADIFWTFYRLPLYLRLSPDPIAKYLVFGASNDGRMDKLNKSDKIFPSIHQWILQIPKPYVVICISILRYNIAILRVYKNHKDLNDNTKAQIC